MRNGYRCGTARVVVESDDEDALRWLAEFVAPWFAPCAPLPNDRLIRYEAASPAFEACARDLARMPAQRLAVFALDGDVVTLAGGVDGGVTLVDDLELGARYRVGAGRIDVVARPGHVRSRIALMRVVREALVSAAQAAAPRLDLHAAAVATSAGAVLLAGPKRAGKTTLLAQLLANAGAGMIANDRVLVEVDRAPPVASGVPTLVAIRPGTLALHPHLRQAAEERPALFHAGEIAQGVHVANAGAAAARDFSLTPAQFAQRSAAPAAAAAPMAAIVFPAFDPHVAGRALVALSPEAAGAPLLAARYGGDPASRPRTIFESAHGADDRASGRSTQAVLRLAAAVPVYRCAIGGDAGNESAAALLRAVCGADAAAELPQ